MIEKVEDIEYWWVVKAESVWRSSQWVKIFHKTVQESNGTLLSSEVEGLRVWCCLLLLLFSLMFTVIDSLFIIIPIIIIIISSS